MNPRFKNILCIVFKQPEWMEKRGWKGMEGEEGRGGRWGRDTCRGDGPSAWLLYSQTLWQPAGSFLTKLLRDLHIISETPRYSQAAGNEPLGLVADTGLTRAVFLDNPLESLQLLKIGGKTHTT